MMRMMNRAATTIATITKLLRWELSLMCGEVSEPNNNNKIAFLS